MDAFTNREYQQKISLAETAVSDMADPQLKQVAFAKILEQLLSQGTDDRRRPTPLAKDTTQRHSQQRSRDGIARGPVGLIEVLVNEQFFQHGKSLRDVQAELQNRGHCIPRTSLSGPLQGLCRRRALRRMKEMSSSGKTVYVYSNW